MESYDFWENFKEIIKKKGLVDDEEILDLIAILPIINLCVKGLSNQTISRLVEEPVDYVESIIQSYLGFPGFAENLEFQLNLWYNDLYTVCADEEEVIKLKNVLDKYYQIERKIEEHYDKHP